MYEGMNEKQQEAVLHTEGPLLILAGAGSGKTRVLTHRTAYLIEEKGVNPYNIMAITFTNKAAGEMRERIDEMVGYGSESIWVSTFHSTCVRILRRFIDHIGFSTNFTIYDADDQKTLMKDICKRLQIDTKIYKERMFLNVISHAKDELIDPITFSLQAQGDYTKQRQATVYQEYQAALRSNNALDFDDLIVKTVELFKTDAEVLDYYNEKFRYIMVDEYQDTNTVQFKFVSLLASKYRNLCVVGDDDQSIYKFRGANIYNILNFEKEYPDAKVIKLEQNYRSTKTILHAANDVIHHNSERKVKKLWTSNDEGEKIAFQQYNSELEEAEGIVSEIKAMAESGQATYKDCAVLYRTNAQSRALEERFVVKGVPYRIFGGQNFYQRKEIKDLLAYLKTVDNGSDDLAVRRIINVPKRGIGITSINKVSDYAVNNGMSFFEACKEAGDIAGLGRSADKIKDFADAILVYRSKLEYLGISGVMDEIIENTGYIKELEAEDTPEAQSRIENIDEFKNKIAEFEGENPEGTLTEFLAEVSLVADIDNMDESDDKVVLMTLHSAKGLEFPYVYMGGMEDGLFPSYMSIVSDDDTAVEEERRLCYVGITRAMKRLKLTCAKTRMVQGQTQYNKVSRFVKEISRDLLEIKGVIEKEKPTEHFSNFASNIKPYTANGSAFSNPYGNPFGNGGVSSSGFRQATPINNQGRKTDLNTLLGQGQIMRGSDLFDKKPSGVQTGSRAGTVYGRQASGRMGTAYGARTSDVEKSALDYTVGDSVRHMKFGVGTVVDIKDGGRDYEVTVDFEKCGVKKMFASFAKLKLV